MNLRDSIVDRLNKHYKSSISRGIKTPKYCTWWFKHKIDYATPEIRRELLKMEREGLVIADREQSNNTKWRLNQSAAC